MELLRHASLFALLTLALALVPLPAAVAFVVRPTDQRLAILRPLSLTGLFGSLAGSTVGLVNALRSAGMSAQTLPNSGAVFIGLAEALVVLFVGFASLSASWLLVAAGIARSQRVG